MANTSLAPSAQAAKPVARADAKSFIIENERIKVTLSSRGGAISKVELKKEFADVTKTQVVTFNSGNDESALAIAVKNPTTGKLEAVLSEFVAQPGASANSITLVGSIDGARVERTFFLAPLKTVRRSKPIPCVSPPKSSPSPASRPLQSGFQPGAGSRPKPIPLTSFFRCSRMMAMS